MLLVNPVSNRHVPAQINLIDFAITVSGSVTKPIREQNVRELRRKTCI